MNIGQTPAHAVGSRSRITVADYPLTQKLIEEDCRHDEGIPNEDKWIVGKVSHPETVREMAFEPHEVKDIKDGKAAIYFHGRVCYFDIFKESHRTDFCLYWKWDAGRLSPGLYCDKGNSTD